MMVAFFVTFVAWLQYDVFFAALELYLEFVFYHYHLNLCARL
jgi:hypothetical protein